MSRSQQIYHTVRSHTFRLVQPALTAVENVQAFAHTPPPKGGESAYNIGRQRAGVYRSGQTGQTVNLMALPSLVRIQPRPVPQQSPRFRGDFAFSDTCLSQSALL